MTEALRHRAPGAIRQYADDRCALLVSERDTHVYRSVRGLLVVDGQLTASAFQQAGVVAHWQDRHELLLEACDGQFAAVACDWSSGRVQVVRDRFGTRSIVWGGHEGRTFVASEPAILHAAGVPLTVRPEVLSTALHFRWLTGTAHLLAPVQQVPAAHETVLHVRDTAGDAATLAEPKNRGADWQTRRYWHMRFSPGNPTTLSLTAAAAQTHAALRDAMATTLDGTKRPVVLLSGGVDSSILAAVLKEITPNVVAITASLPDSANPELARAEFVAQQLGVPLRVVPMSRPGIEQFAATVRRVQELPRNPNNVVLQHLLHAAAGEGDVVLQGDGAEVMFGLSDTETVRRFWAKQEMVDILPSPLRRFIASASHPVAGAFAVRARRLFTHTAADYAAGLAEIRFSDAVRRRLPLRDTHPHATEHLRAMQQALGNDEDALHVYQGETELMSSLLRHERLAQAAGIQTVAPFLLPAVVDVARRLPRELRNAGRSRAVLRTLCDALLPDEVSRWPKLGFEVPWTTWLAPIASSLTDEHFAWALLPPGFVDEAVRVSDPEAIWSAFALRTLVDSLAIDAPAVSSARS